MWHALLPTLSIISTKKEPGAQKNNSADVRLLHQSGKSIPFGHCLVSDDPDTSGTNSLAPFLKKIFYCGRNLTKLSTPFWFRKEAPKGCKRGWSPVYLFNSSYSNPREGLVQHTFHQPFCPGCKKKKNDRKGWRMKL